MSGPYKYVLGPVAETRIGDQRQYSAPAGCVGWIDLRRYDQQSSLGQTGHSFFAMPVDWTVPSEYTLLGGGSGDLRELAFSKSDQDAWEALLSVRPQRSASTTIVDALTESLTDAADPTGLAGPQPLMPGVNPDGSLQQAEIWLPGHSRIKQLSATTLGVGRWGSHCQDMLRGQIDSFEAETASNRSSEKWKDVWGGICQKWLGKHDDPKARDLLSDRLKIKYPNDKPTKPRTTYTEDFDGADSGTLGVDLTWTERLGAWTNTSNQAQIALTAAYGLARADHDVSSTDHECQVDVATLTDGTDNYQAGPAVRYSSSADTFYSTRLLRFYSPDELGLLKLVAGTPTGLGTHYSANATLPITLKCYANGSTIKAYSVGSERDSITDTSITTGTRGGMFAYGGFGATTAMDNWSVADLSAPPAADNAGFWMALMGGAA